MSNEYAIETQNLTKQYGRVEAVSRLNLRVTRHRVTGFLGRNGAGKSSTIKMLLGMIRPSEGSGTVLGRPIDDAKESLEIRRRVAFVGEDKELYGYMSIAELICFTSSFYRDWRPEAARRLQAEYELPAKQKVRNLSKGMRTKLALLLALARRPELLILDEPSGGLDPVSTEELLGTLGAAAAEETTVFFSSHQIAEVERIADRVCIITHGKLAADLSMDEIRQDHRRITLGFAGVPPDYVFHMLGVEQVRFAGRQMVIHASKNADAIVEQARALNAVSIDVAPMTLREVFLETVKDA